MATTNPRLKRTNILKPTSTSGRPVVLYQNNAPIQVKGPDGSLLETLTNGSRGREGYKHPLNYGSLPQGSYLEVEGNKIPINGGGRHEFPIFGDKENVTGQGPSVNKPAGEDGFVPVENKGGGGFQGGGSVGATALPFDVSGLYPNFERIGPNPIAFREIEKAPYKFTDTIEFGKKFGDANREQFKTNFKDAQEYGLQTLDTELKGLEAFVPAASALKRQQTSVDNEFNQAQRTQQVDDTLPGARGVFDRSEATLRAQGDRAATYTKGRLTDPQLDRALELGIRSGAADTASFSGFGTKSQQSSKISDLQSAEARFQIAQYGENLTNQNVQEQQNTQANRANLFLAPTSYSDAGAQVRVTPEVGAGRAATQALGALNESTLISPGQALSTEVQQNQFETQNENRVREFNTTGVFQADTFNSQQKFQADMYNSQGQFAADLGLFNYQAGFAAQMQGANQNILNGALQSQVGQANTGTYNQGLSQAQNAQAIQATIQAVGGVAGASGGVASTAQSGGQTIDTGGSQSPVGGTSTDSSPAQVTTQGSTNQNQKQLETSSTVSSAPQGGAVARPLGADNSVAGGYRFDGNSPVPQGYSPVMSNADGSVTAVRNSDYAQDLQRFGQFGGNPDNAPLMMSAIASADRAMSSAAGLSFQPVQGFQPMGLTSNGGAVSSMPDIATNGDGTLGGQSVANIGTYMAAIGSTDDATARTLGDIAAFSGDQNVHAALDDINAAGGKDAVTQQILNTIGQGVDPNTKAGAQVVAGAMRIGEQWGNLSPAQKSLALSSLADPIVESKTGTPLGDKVVTGTERTAHGALKTREVTQMLNNGVNAVALANNWDQVSAIGRMIGGSKNNVEAGIIGAKLGMSGYGPQGASVPVEKGQLEAVGAEAAPQYGVGAATFPSAKTIPNGYEIVTQAPDGKVIALPKPNAGTSSFKKGSISPLVFKKTQQIAQGAHKAQSSWQSNAPNKGLSKGAAGGSAMLSSLDNMKSKAPHLYNAVAARSLFIATMGAD
ncbi:MAG: hypothetical protein BWY29_00919 [Microgenomates group bacterium ADurb.Bin238]|nr:MAG: hypothetical protein BWY29_00919 [Microgenomates group bacterium ADurb.Bin238]